MAYIVLLIKVEVVSGKKSIKINGFVILSVAPVAWLSHCEFN